MLRKAAVAGRFYPSQPDRLRRDLQEHLGPPRARRQARGVVVPHAGYLYSGGVAGAVFSGIEIPERVLILCPNHTGLGASLSIMSRGEWQIPLGRIPVDEELARRLLHHCPFLTEDTEAHRFEHSLEVQLPFLLHLRPDLRLVPIALGRHDFPAFQRLGKGIAKALRDLSGQPVLVVASSDMNHFEPDAVTRIKDEKAISRILSLDAPGLYEVVRKESISMCGYGPTIAMMYGTEASARTCRAELVRYATSGDAGGGRKEVVGYAGIAIYPKASGSGGRTPP
ncbi:MAG: AmmeMemoRadiSam system protein B [Acidobacteriota bacterium]|nr:AmmeMemoRadiSam system protein B [Acidobacteriota bacterium]